MKGKLLLTIICLTLLVITPVLAGKEAKIDSMNEDVLKKLILAEGYGESEIQINGEAIIVSIEVSDANNYDAELIAWWGSIFGSSALLKGYEKSYYYTIIENKVNGEALMYLGINLVTVDDYVSVLIDDATFWEEVLITDTKPSAKDIADYSGLPANALIRNKSIAKKERNLGWLVILITFLIIGGGVAYLFKKHPEKIKKTQKIVKKTAKKHIAQAKQFYNTKGKEIIKEAVSESKTIYQDIKTEAKETHTKIKKEIEKQREKNNLKK